MASCDLFQEKNWFFMKPPRRLDFTPEEIDLLIDRLNQKCLQEEDYPLLTDVLKAMIWLSFSLQEKELSIKRLRKIFGIKTESAKKLLELAHGKSLDESEFSNEENTKNNSERENEQAASKDDDERGAKNGSKKVSETKRNDENEKKGHGHRSSEDYSEAKTIEIPHQSFKKGDTCPGCFKGRLFQLKSGTVLRIVGQPCLQIEIYRPERLRCSACGKTFTALLPKDIATNSRTDISARAIVALLKYRGGVPFYRQEQIQEVLGAPISASEIWEMTRDAAQVAQSIYGAICKTAANAELIHNDDTKAQILSRAKELKQAEEESKRKGTFTSAIVAVLRDSGIKVGLFFTGWKHAGENLDALLENRQKNLPAPIQECDALSRNIPENHDTQLSNCLGHLRRKFYELVEVWPKEVIRIIGEFSDLFRNDHLAPPDPEERLKWHQEKSGPIMDRIKDYCEGLLEEKKVEPNSSLGKAIAYLRNHWEAFTLFLRVPGVPLTNNDAERLIKRAVLNRKNAYFFRNETGAKIADILMSVMETCILNRVNPYNFLIAIQKYQGDVSRNPELWLPWIYQVRLKELSQKEQTVPPSQ